MTNVNNSNLELNVQKIETKNMNIITDYFTRRRKILIMDSTINAKNFMATDLFGIIFIVISLIYFISTTTTTVGDAITFYGYITKFTYSINGIPYLIWSIVQIKNVSKRLE